MNQRLAGKTFIVRRAERDDGPGILACLRAAFNEYECAYTEGAFIDTVLTTEALEKRLRTMLVYVAALVDDRIVGTLTAMVRDDAEGHLRGMAVDPLFQNLGVATELLAAALRDLRARACRRVTLDTTEPLLRAVRFYESNGFRDTGRRSAFFGMTLHEYARDID